MKPDIHRLIAAINPETYCEPAKRREVRRVLDEGLKQGDPLAIRRAAELAVPMPANDGALDELQSRSAFDPVVLRHPVERHTFSYDSMDQSLEAFYFSLLDDLEGQGWKVTKLIDHLNPSAGSGIGSDLSRRAMKSQQEAARLLDAAQETIEKLMQRVERIKNLERQLAANSFGEKQPTVDLQLSSDKPGETSAERTTGGRDPTWGSPSVDDLGTRLEIERGQLRAQMDLLRLQAHWVQPWLRAAEELRERGSHRADLVTAFNTALLDVVLLARKELPISELIHDGELPRFFAKVPHRNYTSCILIEMSFRAAPRRVTTGTHVFRGRVEVCFTSYALHDEEAVLLQGELKRDEVGQLLSAVGGHSVKATEALLRDIEKLLAGRPAKEPIRSDPNVNPFTALWSMLRDLWRWLFAGGVAPSGIAPDNPTERILRSTAVLSSRRSGLETYAVLKQKLQAP